MRLVWVYVLVTALVFSSLVVAQNPGTGLHKPGPEEGTLAGNIYANEFLGFSFPIPDGWEVNREILGTEREGEAKRTPGGGLELLVIDQHTGKPFRNRIVVSALDAAGMSATTQEYVSKFVKVRLNRDGRQLVQDAVDIELAGRHFSRADYKESSAEVTLHKAFVSTKFRGYFLGWTLVAGSPEELEAIAKSLDRISFREDRQLSSGVIGSTVPAAPGRPLRVRVSQGVSQALLLKKVDPEYPSDARRDHVQGSVVLRATIDTSGNVANLTLTSGDPKLAPAALEAVKQWKYKPYLLNGSPVEVETQVTVAFQLSER
jgi:TonB family protein